MRPRVIKVYSENNRFQRAEVLQRSRVKRQRYGEFLVEGVIPLTRAVENDWPTRALIYSIERRLSRWAQGIIESSKAEVHLELASDLMGKLSEKEEPSELLAILAMPPNDLSRIVVQEDLLVVVFDRPSNHGNLGTVIRSCDALGADGLVLTGHAVDLYDPRTIRASVGSLFSLPVIRLSSHNELLPWFAEIRNRIGDLQIVGTSARADIDLRDADLSRPTVLLVGNETIGLSRSYKDLCDVMVRIQMSGSATSLNVACAASILMYEVDRQRRANLFQGASV